MDWIAVHLLFQHASKRFSPLLFLALASRAMRVPTTILDGAPGKHWEIADGVRRQSEKHDVPLIPECRPQE
jgi:hypothetical protein